MLHDRSRVYRESRFWLRRGQYGDRKLLAEGIGAGERQSGTILCGGRSHGEARTRCVRRIVADKSLIAGFGLEELSGLL